MTRGGGEQAGYLVLSEFALSLSRASDLTSLKAEVIPKLKYAFDFERCGLALLDDDQSSYRLFTLLETRSEMPWAEREVIPVDRGVYGRAIRTREPSLLGDVEPPSPNEPACADTPLEGGSLRSIVCLPLHAGAKTVGSIAFGSSDRSSFGPGNLHLVSLVATHLSLAIDRWRTLEELSAVSAKLQDLNATLEDKVTQTTRDLQDQTRILQSVLDSMGDGVMVADESGQFVLFNPAAEQILGVGATDTGPAEWPETYGAFLADEVTPFPAHELPLVKALRGEETNRVEAFIRNQHVPDGVYVSSSGRALKDQEGRLKGGVIVFHDITERKRAEQQIRSMNEELERRVAERTAQLEDLNRELEAFSYSVSHDLRAPLRRMSAFAGLLREEAGDALSDDAQRYTRTISDSVQQMGRLIDDLLEFSRTGQIELSAGAIDLNALVEEVRRSFVDEERGRDVSWSIGDLPEVRGDHALIRLVLANLLSNALKFTRGRERAHIEIARVRADVEGVGFFVRDNGVGFSMEYAERLFRVFERLHSSEEFEGTGIGLASVERIVHRHGGKIWAEGTENGGATFFVSLPSPSPVETRD